MAQTLQPSDSLERRATNLERNMADFRTAAEALLQTAQTHQVNFETIAAEFRSLRPRKENSARRIQESNERFEILLAELRQLRIEGNAQQTRIDRLQTEIRRISDRLFNPEDDDQNS